MIYDTSEWHGGRLPPGMPAQAALPHMGMFLDWAVSRGLHDRDGGGECPELAELEAGRRSGAQLLEGELEQTLGEWLFGEDARRFAVAYYVTGRYREDCARLARDATSNDRATAYNLIDGVHTAQVAAMLDERFADFLEGESAHLAEQPSLAGVVDAAAGVIRLEQPEGAVGPATTPEQFERLRAAGQSSDGPAALRAVVGGEPMMLIARFDGQTLEALQLRLLARLRNELTEVDHHRRWLRRAFGREARFDWGRAEFYYDPRGGERYIELRFERS